MSCRPMAAPAPQLITGAYVAVADACSVGARTGLLKARLPPNSVAAVSVGIVDGQPRLDLHYDDDVNADTDTERGDDRRRPLRRGPGTAEGEPSERAVSTSCCCWQPLVVRS